MTSRSFLTKYVIAIVAILLFIVLYFSIAGRTLLVRGLIRAGLYKKELKTDRKMMLDASTWLISDNLTFKDSGGKEISLSDQKGKVLFINFWATWCPPCRNEMPSINNLRNRLKESKNIEFYMVDVDNKTAAALEYMERNRFGLPVYSIASFLPPEIFDGNLPTTLVISPEGKVVYHKIGAASYDHEEFVAFMENLLKEQHPLN